MRLTESRLRQIIHESIKQVPVEGRNAKKAKAKTLQIIREFFNNASWLDDEFKDPTNPNHLSVVDYIEDKFRQVFFHANISDSVVRLEPIMMNVALSLGFEQKDQKDEELNHLKAIMDYIILNNRKEGFPVQLNSLTLQNTTYQSLNNVFGKVVDDQINTDNQTANSQDETAQMNPNYEIVKVDDFETANKIGNLSCSSSRLCYTQYKNTWEQYTKNGRNRVYVVLRKEYENIPEEHGENTPFDKYGLSMIFLFISPKGNLVYSNTRWNHQTSGGGPSNVDQSFTKTDISNLLNVNFDSVFKPKEISPLDRYERHGGFYDGYCCVRDEDTGKFNFIDEQGNLLSEQWFYWVDAFSEGFAPVKLNGKYNFINTEGKLAFKQWFDWIYPFRKGFARVKLNGKWNLINSKGEYLSEQWFNWAMDFSEGFASIVLNHKYNFINTEGKLISKQWFDNAGTFRDGFASVKINGKWNFINTECDILSEQWFDDTGNFRDGFVPVELNGEWNFINTDGEIVFEKWFDDAYGFFEGFASVKINGKWNFINTKCEIVFEQWFDDSYGFFKGFAPVKLNGKYNFINTKCEIIFEQWFDDCYKANDALNLYKTIVQNTEKVKFHE